MTDKKSPAEQLLDVFVYGPLGFAMEARELFPKLAERGRGQLTNQFTMAKMMGEFAVKAGQAEAGKRIHEAQSNAASALADLGLWPSQDDEAPVTAETPASAPASEEEASAAPAAASSNGVAPDAAELAIPDYDGLAASQVVPRLEGLAEDELESVRQYEAAHRGRKTVLGKIAQLQSA